MYFHPVRFGLSLGIANALFLLALGIVSGFFNYGNEWVRVRRSGYIAYHATLFGVLFGMPRRLPPGCARAVDTAKDLRA